MVDINNRNLDLDDLASRGPGFGGIGVSTYSVFRGLNALGGIPAIPHNSDNQGLVFFTKPHLNLSYYNVIGIRKMSFLANSNPRSMGALIRCMLNPIGFDKGSITWKDDVPNVVGDNNRSEIIDDKCAFIPISNLLISLSQPPDFVADTYTSNEGYNKEQISMIDGKPGIYNAYDLTATFANMEGDPINAMFSTWLEYGTRVTEGSMLPFPINVIENRKDYETRIWRLVLDRSRTFVQKIFSTIAFPTSAPLGAPHGYTLGTHMSQESDQIQINLRCQGATYDDPILIIEFNRTVATFNPDMVPNSNGVITKLIKVSGITSLGIPRKSLMNFRMYPRISPTMELEWYAYIDEYNEIMSIVGNAANENKNNTNSNPTGAATLSPWSGSPVMPLDTKGK